MTLKPDPNYRNRHQLLAEVERLREIITDLLWEIGLGYDAKEVIARARAALENKP
jgi:hypothetical protein